MDALSRGKMEEAVRLRGEYWRSSWGLFFTHGNEFYRQPTPDGFSYTAEDIVRASKQTSKAGSRDQNEELTRELTIMMRHDIRQKLTKEDIDELLQNYLVYFDDYFFFGGFMRPALPPGQGSPENPVLHELVRIDPIIGLRIHHEDSSLRTQSGLYGLWTPYERRIVLWSQADPVRDKRGRSLQLLPLSSLLGTLVHEMTHAYLDIMAFEHASRVFRRVMMVDDDDGWGRGHGEMFLEQWLFTLNTLRQMVPEDEMLQERQRETEERLEAMREKNQRPLRYLELCFEHPLPKPFLALVVFVLGYLASSWSNIFVWLPDWIKGLVEDFKVPVQSRQKPKQTRKSRVMKVVVGLGSLFLLVQCVRSRW